MNTSSHLSEADVLDFLDAGTNQSSESHPNDPITKARIRVTLNQLQPYDRNPRQSVNPKFDSILASIEARGLDHSPNITRRNPGDSHYIIIDGGNTRLEILNILYEKYTALSKNPESSDQERQDFHEKAQSFFVIDCIFKPWQSESNTLAGHMSENEERGDTLFIEKALAVQAFRKIYEEEDRARAELQGDVFNNKPLTIRALADRISAQGWTVSNSHLSRFEFATNHLLRVVPEALWAGAGQPLIKNIRRLEKGYAAYWATTDIGCDNPVQFTSLFFDTLATFNDETVDINGFTRALDHALEDLLGESHLTISAEVGAMMAGVTPTMNNTEYTSPVDRPKDTAPSSLSPRKKQPPQSQTNASNDTAPAATDSSAAAPLPMTRAANQEAVMTSARALADRYELKVAHINQGEEAPRLCDWFTVYPLWDLGDLPYPGHCDDRAAVWWALFRISRSYQEVSNPEEIFRKAFARYFESGDLSVMDVMLMMYEQEDALPDDMREHLSIIRSLIRHGNGLN